MTIRPFDPLAAEHPLVRDGITCGICVKAFIAGDVPCLVPFKQADDKGWIWEAKPTHWDCYQKQVGD